MKKSQDTPSQTSTQPRKNGRFTTTRTAPAWKEVPLGFKMGPDGKLTKRKGPSTRAERLAGRPPYKMYDLIFQRKGRSADRTYRVLFTNFVVPDKSFEVEIVASTLKQLLKRVTYHVGTLRDTRVTNHFTITFKRVDMEKGMVEETVPVPLGQPLTSPVPSTVHGPLQLED